MPFPRLLRIRGRQADPGIPGLRFNTTESGQTPGKTAMARLEQKSWIHLSNGKKYHESKPSLSKND